MIENSPSPFDTTNPPRRKPRVALMGEFSAGKSTLVNLLLGEDISPVKVTATQLPPVWYSHGMSSMLRVDNTGDEIEISPDALTTISHEQTQAVRVFLETDVLEYCELIDMPGTSDPNMPQRVWEKLLESIDAVVWCTPATQAWRQSEAALWNELPERLRANSLLLVTRMDKLGKTADRERVIARLNFETNDLFKEVVPISLTEALSGRDDPEVLESSGAGAFVESLISIVETPETLTASAAPAEFGALKPETPAQILPMPRTQAPNSVVPRRVLVTRAKIQPGPALTPN